MARTFVTDRCKILLAAVLVGTTGCGGQPDPKPIDPAAPSGQTPSSGTPVGAVTGKVVPKTPEKAVQAYQQAVARQDWATCWTLLYSTTQKEWNVQAAEYRKRFNALADGPEARQAEAELSRMGYFPAQGREMTGERLMTGTCRLLQKDSPDGFRAFAEAVVDGHQEMGRTSLVAVRFDRQSNAAHVLTRRSGVLYYLIIPAPNVLPGAPAPPRPKADVMPDPRNRPS